MILLTFASFCLLSPAFGSRVRHSAQAAFPVDLSKFESLRLLGLGRHRREPAVFLQKESGGPVLPVPVSASSVAALETTFTLKRSPKHLILSTAKATSARDKGLYDNLPWSWNESPLAQRDAYQRLSGSKFRSSDDYPTPYHLLLDMIRLDAYANPTAVLIENTAVLGDRLELGGCLLLEKRTNAESSDMSKAFEQWQSAVKSKPILCECFTDEALGIALALGGEVLVERSVWEQAALPPESKIYKMKNGQMRIEVESQFKMDAPTAPDLSNAILPWEISSAEELAAMSIEEKALCALAGGLELPRARAAEKELVELLEPLLDEDVRRKVRIQRAEEEGDYVLAEELIDGTSIRGRILESWREAMRKGDRAKADELALQWNLETVRRWDITKDPGTYDTNLDQTYGEALEDYRDRERELAKKRERMEQFLN